MNRFRAFAPRENAAALLFLSARTSRETRSGKAGPCAARRFFRDATAHWHKNCLLNMELPFKRVKKGGINQ
jgi:hypothetical protein